MVASACGIKIPCSVRAEKICLQAGDVNENVRSTIGWMDERAFAIPRQVPETV